MKSINSSKAAVTGPRLRRLRQCRRTASSLEGIYMPRLAPMESRLVCSCPGRSSTRIPPPALVSRKALLLLFILLDVWQSVMWAYPACYPLTSDHSYYLSCNLNRISVVNTWSIKLSASVSVFDYKYSIAAAAIKFILHSFLLRNESRPRLMVRAP